MCFLNSGRLGGKRKVLDLNGWLSFKINLKIKVKIGKKFFRFFLLFGIFFLEIFRCVLFSNSRVLRLR